MKILKFEHYRDGGTIEIITDIGTYCFDGRLSKSNLTRGKLFNGYPKNDNSNIIENSKELENEIVEALKKYEDGFYQGVINYFLTNRLSK